MDPASIRNLVIVVLPSLVGPLPASASMDVIAETARQMAILGAYTLPSREQALTLNCAPSYRFLFLDSSLNTERVRGANDVRNYLCHFLHPVLAYQQLTLGYHQSKLAAMQEGSRQLWTELGDRFQWVSNTFKEISSAYVYSNQAIRSSLQQLSALQGDLPLYMMNRLHKCDLEAVEWRQQAEDSYRLLLA